MSDPTEYLKKLAKGLLKAGKAGDAQACTRFRNVYTDYQGVADAALVDQLSLGRAQHVIAVEHGLKNWDVVTKSRPIELYLAITLANEPDLNDAGMGLSRDDWRKPREERDAIFKKDREQIWERIEAIEMAVAWLNEKVKPIKTFSSWRTSYGTKHIAEPDIGYISNGAFIAALLIAGYSIKRNPDSLNPSVALSERSLRAIDHERRENPRPYGWMQEILRERLGMPPAQRRAAG